MAEDNQVENDNNDKNHQAENKSTKNRISKIGTAIKSAAEYGLVDGVGKTIKNFASGAATGAKQGYGYFNNDISKDLAKLEEIVDARIKETTKTLAPSDHLPNIKGNQDYAKLSLIEKIDTIKRYSQEEMAKCENLTYHIPNNDLAWKGLRPAEYNLFTKINNMYITIIKDHQTETLQNHLDAKLDNLAKVAQISNDPAYQNISNYERKLHLIELNLLNRYEENNQKVKLENDQIMSALKKIELLEDQLLNPKQNRVVRGLQTAAKFMTGAVMGGRKESHSEQDKELNSLAEGAQIINDDKYKNASTYQEKLSLIKSKLQNRYEENNQKVKLENDQIMSAVNQIPETKEILKSLKAAEEQLLNLKQNRVVRALKTAAGVIAGATIGIAQGAGRGVKTAVKAVKNAPTGIKETYNKNRNKKQTYSRGG